MHGGVRLTPCFLQQQQLGKGGWVSTVGHCSSILQQRHRRHSGRAAMSGSSLEDTELGESSDAGSKCSMSSWGTSVMGTGSSDSELATDVSTSDSDKSRKTYNMFKKYFRAIKGNKREVKKEAAKAVRMKRRSKGKRRSTMACTVASPHDHAPKKFQRQIKTGKYVGIYKISRDAIAAKEEGVKEDNNRTRPRDRPIMPLTVQTYDVIKKRWCKLLGNDSWKMEEEENLKYVRILQACIRGFLVRRKLQSVQREYLAVVQEIEGKKTALHWRSKLLSMPQFITEVDFPTEDKASEKTHQDAMQYIPSNSRKVSSCGNSLSCEPKNQPPPKALHREHEYLQERSSERTLGWNYTENKRGLIRTDAERVLDTTEPMSERCQAGTPPERDLPGSDTEVSMAFPDSGTSLTEDAPRNGLAEDAPGRGLAEDAPGKGLAEDAPGKGLAETDPGKGLAGTSPAAPTEKSQESLDCSRDSWIWKGKVLDEELPLENLNKLRKHRSHLAMEMLWLQQAIVSRKNYLMVRQKLGMPD
ncbi:IQ domain-containing protein C [Rhinophrynus dorsalis]